MNEFWQAITWQGVLMGTVLIVLAGAVLFMALLWTSYLDKTFPGITRATYHNEIMTVYWSDGEVTEYKGSSTVWHRLPYMKKVSTHREFELSEVFHYIKEHGNPYPVAHLKKDKKESGQNPEDIREDLY
jgi:hypothetical protein